MTGERAPQAEGSQSADGTRELPRSRSPREPLVLAVLAVVAIGTVLVGWFEGVEKDRFGTATPPFVMGWVPSIDPWAIAAALVLGVGAVLGPRLLSPRINAPTAAGLLFLLALAAGLTLSASRGGTYGWWAIFDLAPGGSFEAINEYLPGLPLLDSGLHNYLDRFAETVPSQPVNIAGHGPAPLLLMRALGAETAETLAALCIVGAALCAPLTYAIARTVGTEQTARIAGLLAVFTPVMLLDGFTSFDAVYAALGAGAAALLLARPDATRTSEHAHATDAARGPWDAARPSWTLALGGLAFGVATTFSWALLGVGAAVALAVLFRDGWRRGLVVAAVAGAGFIGVNAVLAIVWGYDPVGTLIATETVYRNSVAMIRPYGFWLFGSPVAWGLLLGPVIFAAAVRAGMRRSPAALAILTVILIAAVAGFTKAETERIWLIFVPLACVAAAPLMTRRRLPLVLGVLGTQALAIQLLYETVW